MKRCSECKTPIDMSGTTNKKTCGPECAYVRYTRLREEKKRELKAAAPVLCIICGVPFQKINPTNTVCPKACCKSKRKAQLQAGYQLTAKKVRRDRTERYSATLDAPLNPPRKCATCGKEITNYRCQTCWKKCGRKADDGIGIGQGFGDFSGGHINDCAVAW